MRSFSDVPPNYQTKSRSTLHRGEKKIGIPGGCGSMVNVIQFEQSLQLVYLISVIEHGLRS